MKSSGLVDYKTDLTLNFKFCQIEPEKIEAKQKVVIFSFGHVEAEILGLEQTRGHFQFFTFLHEFIRNYPVSAILITLLDSRNLNLTSHITLCDIFHT